MAELVSALDDALVGKGRLVMLVGEPGIGKTRTAQELATIAERQGAQTLWGRCYEGEGAPPYWPWVQPIRTYVQHTDAERLRSEMGPGAADIAEIVPEVRDKLPDLEPPPSLASPESARFRLFDSITTILKRAAQTQPLVLVLDDLQWADKSSLLLLEFVARELEDSRLLVVGAYRDVELSRQHPLSESLAQLSREAAFQRVLLRGLNRQDTSRLIEVSSGVVPSSGLAEGVHEQTEGNPFFISEVTSLLEREGKLGVEREELGIRIPEGVREVIGRRLNQLSRECNRVLTMASVIGREFDFRLLAVLVEGMSEDELLNVLEEVLEAHTIEEVAGSSERYQFSHALIQQTLYEELITRRRVRLHARIGEALEGLYGVDVEAHAAELALHFAEAEPMLGTEKLMYYSLMAGEQALATYAWEEALGHFQRGLDAKEGQAMDTDKAALLFGLGRAQTNTLERHRQHEAVTTVIPAFEYYVTAGDVPTALAIAEYRFLTFDGRTGVVQLVAEALKLVPSDSHQAGRLLVRYGVALFQGLGSFEAAVEALGQALAIAQRENDTALEQTVLTVMANAHWIMNLDPQASLENSLRAIELDHRVSQSQPDHTAHWHAALALIALGDLEGAGSHAAASLAIAEKRGDRFRVAAVLHVNEALAHLQGNWETARDLSDRGLAVAPRDARIVPNRAILEYELGDFGQGDVYLERLVETMRLSPPGPTLEYSVVPLTIGVAARITGMARQFDIAEAAADTALSSPTVPYYAQLARTGVALMAVERGDVAAAREQYDALMSWRITMGGLNHMCGHRVLGLLAQTMGNLDDALAHFEESLAFCRKASARPELAWTSYDYADALIQRNASGDHVRALTLLDEALYISSELGMKPLTERVIALEEKAQAQPARAPQYPDGLTQREVEVLRLVASGSSNAQIASELVLSIRTVERHISNIYIKTNSRARADATAFAFAHGLISSE